MRKLEFEINGVTATCELFENDVPKTCNAIIDLLPCETELHYAKFAGQEVFGIIPLLMPLEKYSLVSELETGSVAYYPDRQLLCIYYGEVQEEEAGVTVIGHLISDEKFINEMENVRDNQGLKMIIREHGSEKKNINKHKHIIQLDEDIWEKPLEEILDMKKRRGYTQPIGPILYSEGALRDLIGLLWKYRESYIKNNEMNVKDFRDGLSYFCQIIGGWCGLKKTANLIREYYELLAADNAKELEVLDDMILFISRIHMWIDLLIPWEDFNQLYLRKLNSNI